MNARTRQHHVGAFGPASIAACPPGWHYLGGKCVPPLPKMPVQWTGPDYAPDGAHVWRLTSYPDQYAYVEFGGSAPPGFVWPTASALGGARALWIRREQKWIPGPPQNPQGQASYEKLKATILAYNASRPWTIVCRALPNARKWSCPRGIHYPPLEPSV